MSTETFLADLKALAKVPGKTPDQLVEDARALAPLHLKTGNEAWLGPAFDLLSRELPGGRLAPFKKLFASGIDRDLILFAGWKVGAKAVTRGGVSGFILPEADSEKPIENLDSDSREPVTTKGERKSGKRAKVRAKGDFGKGSKKRLLAGRRAAETKARLRAERDAEARRTAL